MGSFLRREHLKTAGGTNAGTIFAVVGSLYGYVLLWLSLHAAFLYAQDIATMLSLLCYTVVGLVFYIYGKLHEHKLAKTYGAVLLMLVAGRLLLIDVWDMALTGRIITFFVVGALFMSTAFIRHKKPNLEAASPLP